MSQQFYICYTKFEVSPRSISGNFRYFGFIAIKSCCRASLGISFRISKHGGIQELNFGSKMGTTDIRLYRSLLIQEQFDNS